LVIALTALRAGETMLVKASIAGAIVTNTLFMLGGGRFSSAASNTTRRNTTGSAPDCRPGCSF
jgi:Ca2+/H+ antiporter